MVTLTAGLQVQALSALSPDGGRKLFSDVDFVLPPGSSLGILGPNGAGKSSLLRALAGLLPLQSGRLQLNERDLLTLNTRERARLLAWVNPREQPPPFALGAQAYLRLGRAPWQNWLGGWTPQDEAALQQAIANSGVTELLPQALSSLSSGEWQRLQLARALTQTPALLLLDEPTSHLDLGAQLAVMGQLRRLCQQGLSLICVVHELNLAAQYMDQLLLLHHGRVQACGPPESVLTPEHIAAVYGISCEIAPHPQTGRPLLVPRYT
ncbi:MAG: ABC transporter ATP-binding protein [Candidatus Sericytochromatia bacterium]